MAAPAPAGNWEWQDEHGSWNSYSPRDQLTLNSNRGGTCSIRAPNGQQYIVDTVNMFQQNMRYRTRRPIRHVAAPAPAAAPVFAAPNLVPAFGLPFTASAAAAAPARNPWPCPICTYINKYDSMNCEMCMTGTAPHSAQLLQNLGFASQQPMPVQNPVVQNLPAYGGPPPKRRKKKKKGGSHRPPTYSVQQPNNSFISMFPSNRFSGYGGGPPVNAAPASDLNVFKDPAELAAEKAEAERQRVETERNEGNEQIQMLLPLLRGRLTDDDLGSLLMALFDKVPPPEGDQPMADPNQRNDTCQICYCPFQDDECQMETCGHTTACIDCFRAYVRNRIKDDDIMPWIPCPEPDCRHAVAPRHFELFDRDEVVNFLSMILSKTLARNSMWVCCQNDDCVFGFLIEDEDQHQLTCEVCNTSQVVTRAVTQDDSIQELIRNGSMRKCPKCEDLTMKDKGICNVIQCGKCKIWWNWKTRETGNSQREMKNRARMNGTLWEPGELAYQQRLQRTDPAAFALLLERNGIKYDPNYRRGT